jgi:hypothetical protein
MNVVVLPTTIVYESVDRNISGDRRYENFVTKLCYYGDPPLIYGPNGKTILKSGMKQYYDHIITHPLYPYNTIDAEIYEQNVSYVSDLLSGAIAIDLGVGGAEGAKKTNEILKRIPEDKQKPIGLILVDGVESNAKEAKKAIGKNGNLRASDIKAVCGSVGDTKTWKDINTRILQIQRNNPSEGLQGSRYYTSVALMQSPTYNAFNDEEATELFTNLHNIAAQNNSLFLAIDNTQDLDTLRGAYDNPPTRQFVLSAIVQYCWLKGISIDPLKTKVDVQIIQENGWVKITHSVIDEENNVTYSLAGLRKFSENYMQLYFKANQIAVFKTLGASLPQFPHVKYAVQVCNTGPKM